MKDERNDGTGANKPFYENIVAKHKRKKPDSGKPRSPRDGDASLSRDGDARPRRDNDGYAPRDGARSGSYNRREDDRSPRDDRGPRDGGGYAPRGDAHPSRRDDARSPRDNRDGYAPRGDFRPPRDSDARPRRDDRDGARAGSYARRDNRRPRDGYAPSGARTGNQTPVNADSRPRYRKPFEAPTVFSRVFNSLSPETKGLLDSFFELASRAMSQDSRKLQELPNVIREMSHSLTDERQDRRIGYMNDPANVSAYVRYFMWWNLVRLTRLFASLPLNLSDGDAACDLGSGPLTVPIALWMSRPELRELKLTWYCVDISQNALAVGEELFLSLVAKTGGEPWKIVRIKGECGVSLKRRVALVASANMFNEVALDGDEPLEALSKRYARDLSSYAENAASVLVIEPGIPRAARFVSLLRDSLARLGFAPAAPCPHAEECPFPGLRHGKWCHFVFDTADAPAKLHKLSEDAGLPKDRAALSYILAARAAGTAGAVEALDATDAMSAPRAEGGISAADVPASAATSASLASRDSAALAAAGDSGASPLSTVARLKESFTTMRVRIVSDPIKLPEYYTGRYGCSEEGMVMVCGTYEAGDWLRECVSGTLIGVSRPDPRKGERDGKTGALIVRLGKVPHAR